MRMLSRAWLLGPIAVMAFAASAQANEKFSQHTNRTYFGRPGVSNGAGYAAGVKEPKFAHPWTCKLFGVRYCRTPADRYDAFLRRHAILQAKAIAAANSLDWAAYDEYYNGTGTVIPTGCGCVAPCGGWCGFGPSLYKGSQTCPGTGGNAGGLCGLINGLVGGNDTGCGLIGGGCGGGASGCGGASGYSGVSGGGCGGASGGGGVSGGGCGDAGCSGGCGGNCGSAGCGSAGCDAGCGGIAGAQYGIGACGDASCTGCGKNGCGLVRGSLAGGGPFGRLFGGAGAAGGAGAGAGNPWFGANCGAGTYNYGSVYGNGYIVKQPYSHPAAAYPPMNREDALRYLQGFQYYPPYQVIRSPRDFYMFDQKYGIGQ